MEDRCTHPPGVLGYKGLHRWWESAALGVMPELGHIFTRRLIRMIATRLHLPHAHRRFLATLASVLLVTRDWQQVRSFSSDWRNKLGPLNPFPGVAFLFLFGVTQVQPNPAKIWHEPHDLERDVLRYVDLCMASHVSTFRVLCTP